jgi:hypothetical protein
MRENSAETIAQGTVEDCDANIRENNCTSTHDGSNGENAQLFLSRIIRSFFLYFFLDDVQEFDR